MGESDLALSPCGLVIIKNFFQRYRSLAPNTTLHRELVLPKMRLENKISILYIARMANTEIQKDMACNEAVQ